MESSKYSSLVAGIASANSSAAILANAAPTGSGPNAAGHSLLAAAAAAAAAAVVSSASATPVGAMASSGNPSSMSHANTTAGSYSHYSAQHQHSHNSGYTAHSHSHQYPAATHNSAYDVSALGLSHSSGISASTPSLSAQVVAAAALAQGAGPTAGHPTSALDLHSYSISAFSRPLSQSSPTSAAIINSDATAPALAGNTAGNSNSFAGISQALSQQPTQHSQPPYHQQRSYSDYSAYYRSPSATMGLGTGSTTATGASPTSGTGMNAAASTGASAGNPTQLAAAAAAAAAAMGTGYYASAAAYQPYMRTSVGGSSNTYYYAQPQSRYLPYSAYPPIRHFVSPARPFKCETCDQSFSRNHDLKRHVKIHSGVKPHKCPKCGKSFGRSDALKRHSMVKRCRSSTSSAAAKSSPPPTAQSSAQGMSAQRIPQVGSQRFDSASSRLPLHPQLHHVQQAHSLMQQGIAGSSGAAMPSVPSSSRLAPVASSMFSQGGGGNASAMAMSASTNSIVSSMLSSRTNTI
ncbi:hypothetical protein IWW37_003228 [Coemansia sp. RSA 2050]|nr:hypothetical protein IWW37_003228 [Coemansia sp. RSA 2050]KAJ2736518.1 hypothetical protein IW152_000693 [Coemansia sp. BCRC 34962]